MNPRLKKLLPILGPGWVVMMADLDGPSVITAIQSGFQFQAHIIIILLVLTLPLYLIQSTASRIGAVTQKSLGKIIIENFGMKYSIFTLVTTAIIDFAAYVGEFTGASIAAIILGIPIIPLILIIVILHTVIILSGKYIQIEMKLVLLSFILFIFPFIDIFFHPSHVSFANLTPYVQNYSFLYIVAANIGAVIMPWMLFYHQAADVDRGINIRNLGRENKGTIIGALISELLMISIVIFSWKISQSSIVQAGNEITILTDSFRLEVGNWFVIIFGLALLVSSFLALMVISMSMSYTLSDALKIQGSFNSSFRENKLFYTIYFVEIIPAALIVLFYKYLVQLALNIMVLNSIILAFPLYAIIKISSDEAIMGKYKISRKAKYTLIIIGIVIIAAGSLSLIF